MVEHASKNKPLADDKKAAAILRLGFGASGAWGRKWFNQNDAIGLIEQAYENGVRYFDTAGFYANGEAERRLGIALKGCDDVFISTKTGTIDKGLKGYAKDFSNEAIEQSLEQSLKRLGRDKIDCLYLHGPEYWVVSHTKPLFDGFKKSDLIARAGVCGQGATLEESVQNAKTDAIMGVYNLFSQSHRKVFSAAKQKNIQICAIEPLAQSIYRRSLWRPKSIADLWVLARALKRGKNGATRDYSEVRKKIEATKQQSYEHVLLGYALSNQDIDVVMTTTTRVHHLTQSLNVARLITSQGAMPSELIEKLENIARSPE